MRTHVGVALIGKKKSTRIHDSLYFEVRSVHVVSCWLAVMMYALERHSGLVVATTYGSRCLLRQSRPLHNINADSRLA